MFIHKRTIFEMNLLPWVTFPRSRASNGGPWAWDLSGAAHRRNLQENEKNRTVKKARCNLRSSLSFLLAILWNSAFKWVCPSFSPLPLAFFLSQLFVRPPQTTILPFCISFSWGWSWSLSPKQCHEPLSIILEALCLSDLIPWIYFSLPLYNCKGFDLDYTWLV